MAGQSSKGTNRVKDAERAPLLGVKSAENGKSARKSAEEDTEAGGPVKAARWVARHAVIVFMSLLILAVIIVLCLFFGSKKSPSSIWYLRICLGFIANC